MEMTISALIEEFENVFSMSDDNYAEELQFLEALQASLNLSTLPPQSSSSSSRHDLTSTRTVSCEICTEEKQKPDMFQLEGCPHSFCSTCMAKHVEYKLRQNIVVISCPAEDCNNVIEPAGPLRRVMPPDMVARWEEAIIASTILDSQKIHCPYEDCSEMLVDDGDEGVVVKESECPVCRRLFCAQCRVPWHQGFDCEEFRRLNRKRKDKEELRLLAREKKWKKCPNCKVFVDKTEGCIHITCRYVD
ncbi:putative E3 ubiquitin-protein ligase [Sesamum alatum]|uniref:RBR-type E3 ubiquitin transferase n=1 Tax=Sesamum alatum TaxID=300844 RepID=A0AAE1XMF7_9LAMI|nr:putative E3 ubiquitin-protein ligase [Sesamum alatum]